MKGAGEKDGPFKPQNKAAFGPAFTTQTEGPS